jgi:hypothetical protein
LTVNGFVGQVGHVALAGNASLNPIDALRTVPAVVTMSGSSGMVVSGLTIIGGVGAVLTGVSGMTLAGWVAQVAQTNLSATASLVVASQTIEVTTVTLQGTSGLTATGGTKLVATVDLLGNTGLSVLPSINVVVTHQAFAFMSVTGAMVDLVAQVHMTPQSSLLVAPTANAQVSMAATSGMVVAGKATHLTPVAMTAVSSFTATGTTFIPAVVTGQVALTGQSSLSIAGRVQQVAAIKMAGTTSLSAAAWVWVRGNTVAFSAQGRLSVISAIAPPVLVTMLSRTSLIVTADRVGPITKPPLEWQIGQLVGTDPILLGASGYLDPVFTTRLVGDSE